MPRPTKAPARPFRISGAPATRALASATRQEIVDTLASAGPCTVVRLADLLGRKPDALYFHLRALARVGLVREQHTPDAGGAAVFELPAPSVQLDYAAAPRPDLARVVRNALKLSLREFERECLAGRGIGREGRRILWGGRATGWVNDAQLADINSLIDAIHRTLRRGGPGPGRRAIALGFLLAPSGFGERSRSSRKISKATKATKKE
ncbi:MAG: helix-turn-helix transcriptional regulator [Phycisphaerae bacterium]|nr:helix-turn-helix transcriptional regulator [Phycisphaerae bacterium]